MTLVDETVIHEFNRQAVERYESLQRMLSIEETFRQQQAERDLYKSVNPTKKPTSL